MARKSEADKQLEAYGYELTADEGYVRSKAGTPRERLVPVEGGYERYIRSDGKWLQMPYQVNEKWAGISGMTFESHPECFDTVYPTEHIEHIYSVANQERANNARPDKK